MEKNKTTIGLLKTWFYFCVCVCVCVRWYWGWLKRALFRTIHLSYCLGLLGVCLLTHYAISVSFKVNLSRCKVQTVQWLYVLEVTQELKYSISWAMHRFTFNHCPEYMPASDWALGYFPRNSSMIEVALQKKWLGAEAMLHSQHAHLFSVQWETHMQS